LRFVQMTAYVPDDLCLTSLREIMALNKVKVRPRHALTPAPVAITRRCWRRRCPSHSWGQDRSVHLR
jgi:hypothetical protein